MAAPARIFPTSGFTAVPTSTVPRRTARAERIPAGALESSALECVDGTRTVAEIAARIGLAEIECSALITRLTELGCVTLDGGPELNGADDRETLPAFDVAPPAPAKEPRRPRSGQRRRLLLPRK